MTWRDSNRSQGDSLFAASEQPQAPPQGGSAQTCPPVCQLVQVGFTDKPGAKALFGGQRKQYVNLRNTNVLAGDTDITSENQVGHRPPIFVKVQPPAETQVQVRLKRTLHRGGFPAGSATLTTNANKRVIAENALSHLAWASRARTYTTDDKGELLIEPGRQISALGGGEFHAEAALVGRSFTTSANSVLVKRRVYLRPVVHNAAGRDAALGAMRAIRSTLDALGIEVKLVPRSSGAEYGVQEKSTLSDATLIARGNAALGSSTSEVRKLQPHSAAVIVGEFLVADTALQPFSVVATRTGGVFPASVNITLQSGSSAFVFVPLTNGTGFGSCKLTAPGVDVTVPRARVSNLSQFTQQLTVDISAATAGLAPTVMAVTVTLNVKAINRWAVGWAYNQHPVIYLNMRDPNTNTLLTATRAQALMVHELGHKLHLAAPGVAGQPDQQAHHYPTGHQGTSHVGPHCSHGVPSGTLLNTTAASNASDCTMWGALKTLTAFCDECKTSLRKVDLSAGF